MLRLDCFSGSLQARLGISDFSQVQQNYDSFPILTAAPGCSTPTDEFQGGAGLELLLLNLILAEAKARSLLLTHKRASSSGAEGERLEVVAFIFGVHRYVFNTWGSRWTTVVLQ